MTLRAAWAPRAGECAPRWGWGCSGSRTRCARRGLRTPRASRPDSPPPQGGAAGAGRPLAGRCTRDSAAAPHVTAPPGEGGAGRGGAGRGARGGGAGAGAAALPLALRILSGRRRPLRSANMAPPSRRQPRLLRVLLAPLALLALLPPPAPGAAGTQTLPGRLPRAQDRGFLVVRADPRARRGPPRRRRSAAPQPEPIQVYGQVSPGARPRPPAPFAPALSRPRDTASAAGLHSSLLLPVGFSTRVPGSGVRLPQACGGWEAWVRPALRGGERLPAPSSRGPCSEQPALAQSSARRGFPLLAIRPRLGERPGGSHGSLCACACACAGVSVQSTPLPSTQLTLFWMRIFFMI